MGLLCFLPTSSFGPPAAGFVGTGRMAEACTTDGQSVGGLEEVSPFARNGWGSEGLGSSVLHTAMGLEVDIPGLRARALWASTPVELRGQWAGRRPCGPHVSR